MKTRWPFPIVVSLAVCALGARGWAASAESNVIAVDTRSLTMTRLVIAGPSPLMRGADGEFLATLEYAGAPPKDVTAQCQWSVDGGPPIANDQERPKMEGNLLTAQAASTAPLRVTASVQEPTGRIVSEPFGWQLTAGAFAYGHAQNEPGMTFEWALDGQPIATGAHIDRELTGRPGSWILSVLVTDNLGHTGVGTTWATFNAPEIIDEPPLRTSAIPAGGQFKRKVENGATPIQIEDYAPRAERISVDNDDVDGDAAVSGEVTWRDAGDDAQDFRADAGEGFGFGLGPG